MFHLQVSVDEGLSIWKRRSTVRDGYSSTSATRRLYSSSLYSSPSSSFSATVSDVIQCNKSISTVRRPQILPWKPIFLEQHITHSSLVNPPIAGYFCYLLVESELDSELEIALEYTGQASSWTFLIGLYYVFTTISCIGFGDIYIYSPGTILRKVIITSLHSRSRALFNTAHPPPRSRPP